MSRKITIVIDGWVFWLLVAVSVVSPVGNYAKFRAGVIEMWADLASLFT